MVTPYPDVNAVLEALLARASAILGGHITGLYLYGSLSSGDFDPHSSDIDFAFVTESVLPPETVAALEAADVPTGNHSPRRVVCGYDMIWTMNRFLEKHS